MEEEKGCFGCHKEKAKLFLAYGQHRCKECNDVFWGKINSFGDKCPYCPQKATSSILDGWACDACAKNFWNRRKAIQSEEAMRREAIYGEDRLRSCEN